MKMMVLKKKSLTMEIQRMIMWVVLNSFVPVSLRVLEAHLKPLLLVLSPLRDHLWSEIIN
jgi:hypothetical protein